MAADIRLSGGKVRTPAGDAPVIPLLLFGLGAYLMWFGVHYWRGTGDLAWPSTPIKSVLQGNGLPANSAAASTDSQLTAYETGTTTGPLSTELNTGNLPAGGNPVQNQNIGRLLAGQLGWGTGQNWQALNYGWGTLESGWNDLATNTGGAFGIAQALGHGTPSTKGTHSNMYGPVNGMTFPDSLYVSANSGNATAQITWGLDYIRRAYGQPANVPGWLGQPGYSGY